ncbi:phosphate ABC transporter substrate-binding protein [Candidatus Aerophobetes bacterium]|nr:phosphate ABC transporter substrate-binding protein [Candidatus Aerophobetes bacterium]
MKVRGLWGPVVLAAALVIVTQFYFCGLSGARTKSRERLSIQGSTTILPIAQAIAEEYMDLADRGLLPEMDITVRGGGSGVGITALLDGTIDIAMASRPIKPGEIERARKKGFNPVPTIIAKDGIAVIVHPSNSIKGLNIEQLKAIYTGQISTWSKVGGQDKSIVVISRDTASGTFETFKKLVLKGEKVRNDALMLASNQAVATTVAKTPGAIGYVGLGYLSERVKALEIDKVEPSQRTVVNGDYKLSRPLFMYTHGEPKGMTKKFIDFVLSLAGQRVVKDLGFVPLG